MAILPALLATFEEKYTTGPYQQTGFFNSSLTGQNDRHFADDIFKWIFINEKFCILI